MDKVSKAKTILRAFTEKSPIDKEELAKRLEICRTCPFNSNNADRDSMSIVQCIRKDVTPITQPFCTACNCQINEKASQETEECGLVEKGEAPKWNRLVLETANKTDLNLINLNPDKVNVSLEKGRRCYVIDVGSIVDTEYFKYGFLLKSLEEFGHTLTFLQPGCSSCLTASFKKRDNNTSECEVVVKATEIGKGPFSKKLYFGYNYEHEEKVLSKRVLVKVIGEII